jgi:hypothetical protein
VDSSFDPTLKELLVDKDIRKRGLAAYIAVHLWKEKSFDAMRAMLKEEAQLLRFDAVSALAMEGGSEGLKIIKEHAARESNHALKQMIKNLEKGNR